MMVGAAHPLLEKVFLGIGGRLWVENDESEVLHRWASVDQPLDACRQGVRALEVVGLANLHLESRAAFSEQSVCRESGVELRDLRVSGSTVF